MQAKIDRIAQKVIEISFYALFFLTPLLWNPYNSELFELPKMFFVWAVTIVIAGAWLIRIINRKSLIFNRTVLDIPLLIFLIIQLLSYAFSIDRHTSLWGYYSRFNGGLLSTIAYLILYWSFVSNMNSKTARISILYSLFSGFLVALWGIPAHFGYDPTCLVLGRGLTTNCWSDQFVPTQRIFSTLGQPNWLAAYLVALLPISIAFALRSKSILYSPISILFLIAIIFTRSQSGFLGLGVAAAVFATGIFWKRFKPQTWLLIFLLTLLGSILVIPRTQLIKPINNCFQILNTQYSILNTDITPSSDIRCIVWKGAIDIWKHYPIFGSGPETFAYTYYSFKPIEHNLTSEWDFLYNKAHNEYLNYLANTGIAGLTAYLLLATASIWLIVKSLELKGAKAKELSEHYALKLALLAGYISILVINFFGFSVVPVQLLFFLFPAIALTFTQNESIALRPKLYALSSTRALLITFVLIVTCYLLLTTFRFYLADLSYASAQKLNSNNDYINSLTAIRKTIEIRPDEPVYQNGLADIASSIAYLAYEQDATLSAQLAKLAENASDRALATSPRNITTLKIRSNVFITLAQLDPPTGEAGPSYIDKARESLEKAQELAPTDARIAYNLGLLYWQIGKLNEAKMEFEKAVMLRPTYSEAQQALQELNKR